MGVWEGVGGCLGGGGRDGRMLGRGEWVLGRGEWVLGGGGLGALTQHVEKGVEKVEGPRSLSC